MRQKKYVGKIIFLLSITILGCLMITCKGVSDIDKGKEPVEIKKINKALFNKQYKPEELGTILSWMDSGKAFGAVTYHNGLVIAPMSYDFGGGLGDGALAAYNIDDPRNPNIAFDSRNYPEIYHDPKSKHYLGDIAEIHGMYFHNDMVMLTERGHERNGFMILDLAPLYDNDESTLPKIVSRFYFPDVAKSTVYDGFSFSPVWAGGRYVYAPTGTNGLYIIDTKDIKNPKLASHLRKDQLYNQILRSANAIGDVLVLSPAAIASTKSDIVLVDVSNPYSPSLINHHTIKLGYQGIVYGSKYYNGSYAASRGKAKESELLAYDFQDPLNIKEINFGTVDKLSRGEYVFVKDDDLYIGHYPGLSKWKINKEGKAEFVVGVEPEHPKADDYAFTSPLGNLIVVTSDHLVESKFNIGVHDINPDFKGPELRYVLPKKGEKNVSIQTKIGISMSDFLNGATLENRAVYVIEKRSGKEVPCTFGQGMGIVHAIPKNELKKNTSYQVYVTEKLQDLVGNPYEGESLVTEFSTGKNFSDYNSKIMSTKPVKVGQEFSLKTSVDNEELNDVLYAWSFGDEKEHTPFTKKNTIVKKIDKPGNYSVTLITKREGSDKLINSTAVQVVYEAIPDKMPESSSSICFSTDEKQIYVVNPDNNTVAAFDTFNGSKLYEVSVGQNPVSIANHNNQLWISCNKSDEIQIFDSATGKLIKKVVFPHGSAPFGLVVNRVKNVAYVALTALGEIQEIDLGSYKLLNKISIGSKLQNISYLPKKEMLIAPELIASEQKGAKVFWIDVLKWRITNEERLQPSMNNDGIANGRGFPNYLNTVAVNPQQTKAWIPGKKDNLFRGLKRDGQPLVFDQTVRSIAVSLDINTQKEVFNDRIDLDNNDFASATAYNSFGNIMYIATRGSQTIWAVDAYNPTKQSVYSTYGAGTNALLINNSSTKLYVHNQLSRNLTVFDAKPDGELKFKSNWETVTNEKMAANVLRGKRLFNNTTRSSMSQEGYMSCASCHIDGSHDGRVWDISNLGEGLRNTIDLRGKEGMKHGMLHWTGNFDEVQDFNNQITALNQGTGFIFDKTTMKHPQRFETKFGIHRELDDLAAYVSSLNAYPKSPYKTKGGQLTKQAAKGKQHFIDLKCYTCHAGPAFTDSNLRLLHDVGTQDESTAMRLGKKHIGLDTPTLISLWQSAPYLHNGSAKNLNDVFTSGSGEKGQEHQVALKLKKSELDALKAYLLQIDTEEGIQPKDLGLVNNKPSFDKQEYTFDYIYRYGKRRHYIGKVGATDQNKNQKIKYTLEPTGYAGLFEIDNETGDLYLNYQDLAYRHPFNYYKVYKGEYGLNLRVQDNGELPEYSTVKIEVRVIYPTLPVKNVAEFRSYRSLYGKKESNKKLSEKDDKIYNDYFIKNEKAVRKINFDDFDSLPSEKN